MNVTINSEKSCFTVSTTQENLAKLIAFAMEIAEGEGNSSDVPAAEPMEEIHYGLHADRRNLEKLEDNGTEPEEGSELYDPEEENAMPAEEYKGFLRIRCRWCGAVHSFCVKEPISEFRCKECGGKTKLENLKKMYANCKCGERYKYYTNEETQNIVHNCLNCGAPIDLELNSLKNAYITIRDRIGGGTRHSPYDILTRKIH